MQTDVQTDDGSPSMLPETPAPAVAKTATGDGAFTLSHDERDTLIDFAKSAVSLGEYTLLVALVEVIAGRAACKLAPAMLARAFEMANAKDAAQCASRQ